MVSEILRAAMNETANRLQKLASDSDFLQTVESAGNLLADAFAAQKSVFACGNGGSMCDAMHFAEELSGRFREDRAPLPASAISDPAYISCTANDYGYQHVFSRYLQAHAREGDVLIALSTSGRSPNIIAGAKVVQAKGGKVVSLTGKPDSELGALADIDLCVGTTGYADRAQEVHILLLHSLVQMVEERLFAGVGVGS
jgi:D-sedoheptulose 7-phosphate isomerase